MKTVLKVLFVLILLAITAPSKASNDVVIGHRESGDELIHVENIRKYNLIPLMQVTIEKTYAGDETITQIKALDMDKNSRGGTAVVTAGGVGSNLVTIKFTNKLSLAPTAIDFKVKIYGIKAVESTSRKNE